MASYTILRQEVEDYQKAMGRYQTAVTAYNEKADAYRTEYNTAANAYNSQYNAYKANALAQDADYAARVNAYNAQAEAYNSAPRNDAGIPQRTANDQEYMALYAATAAEYGGSLTPSSQYEFDEFKQYNSNYFVPLEAPSQASIGAAPNYGTAPTANLPKEIDPFTKKAPTDPNFSVSDMKQMSSPPPATVDSGGESVMDQVKTANGVSGSAYTGSMDSDVGILQKVMNKKL